MIEEKYLKVVKKIVFQLMKESGDILIENQNKLEIIDGKNELDFHTNIDSEIEKLFFNKITEQFPEHNIYSEEIQKMNKASEYTWIIDPIDGSKHYAKGLPLFSVSVALKKQELTIFGTIFNPVLNELFWATPKEGAYLNDKRINVSKTQKLKNCFVLIDVPNRTADVDILDFGFNIMRILLQKVFRIRIYGVSALSLCYLAAGRVDAYISLSPRTEIYDIAAGQFIIEMANGKVTDLSSPTKPLLVFSNNKIHEELLEVIQNGRK